MFAFAADGIGLIQYRRNSALFGQRWQWELDPRDHSLGHLLEGCPCPSSEQSGRFEAVANGGFGASGFAV
jgi:hypothetical protein